MKGSNFWIGGAVLRGIESFRPDGDRLFDDGLALALIPSGWRRFLQLLSSLGLIGAVLKMRESQFPGVVGNLLCRTRHIDDVVRERLEAGLDQVVLLGAGFDTRAYRIPGIDQTLVFDVDHPAVQSEKKERLREIKGAVPSHVRFVPIDFEREGLESGMLQAGYSSGARTLLVWEGVTQYISSKAVDATWRWATRTGGDRSSIVFTYIREGIIDGSSRSHQDEKLMSLARRNGVPWVFGIDPDALSGYLTTRDLELLEEAGTAEYRRRCVDPLGRKMAVYEGELVALAATGGRAQGADAWQRMNGEMTPQSGPESREPTGPEESEPASSLIRRLELEDLEHRLDTVHRKEKRHLTWLVLGLSPAAAIPALGLLLEGRTGLLLLLLVLVAVSQLVSWNIAAREAERLENELHRLREENWTPGDQYP
jgi:methyltransferase (TIGR00027 family)